MTVTDTNGDTAAANFTLTVNSAVVATQAIATETTAYNSTTTLTPVNGSGGTGALSYSISPTLPVGLNLNAATGQVTGAPTTVSSLTSYTVTVTDINNASATADFTLTVNPAIQTLSFATGTVPLSAPYNTTFTPAATSTSGLAAAITVGGSCSISAGS